MSKNQTSASAEQIAAKQAAKDANVAKVAQGLPQLATKPGTRKVLSVMEILAARQGTAVVAPKPGKQVVMTAEADEIEKKCPELTKGLLQADGSAHPGALVWKDSEGKYGPKGGIYVVRFCPVNKSFAKLVIERYGKANRTSTPSTIKTYLTSMNNGIGGDSGPHGWNFVFNSIIFTVNSAGSITGMDFEQHNGAHSSKALLEATDPNAEILTLMCWGVPKSMRDLVDKNLQRSAKDIASTRTELKNMFRVGAMIGGIVPIAKEEVQTRCINFVTQTVAIVNNIRNGEQAKTGGNQGVDATVLDLYCKPVAESVTRVYAMDYVSQWTGKNAKTGLPVPKTSGGLTQLYAVNHLSAVMTLIASYVSADGTIVLDEDMANEVMQCYSVLANRSETDATEPMVSLRNQIDTWDTNGQHKGSTGMNVRFTALTKAVVKQLSGEKIVFAKWLSAVDGKTTRENLSGHGFVTGSESVDTEGNPIPGSGIVLGIDDYVNPGDAAMDDAGIDHASEADATLQELVDDSDEEMTEVGSDQPEDDTPEL